MMLRLLLCCALAGAAGSAHAVLVADYRLQNSLSDALGVAPDLVPVLAGDGGFANETVGDQSRIVRGFGAGGGFALDVDGLLGRDTYSVALLMRFDQVTGYRRIFDTLDSTSDLGLYVLSGDLVAYQAALSHDSDEFDTGWHQVVLTRTANGMLAGYIDGNRQFLAPDENDSLRISEAAMLRFFVDDGSENSAGAVARIRLWDHALSRTEVAQLDDTLSEPLLFDGFESP